MCGAKDHDHSIMTVQGNRAVEKYQAHFELLLFFFFFHYLSSFATMHLTAPKLASVVNLAVAGFLGNQRPPLFFFFSFSFFCNGRHNLHQEK